MKVALFVQVGLFGAGTASGSHAVFATNTDHEIKYVGFERNGVDIFLGIKYGEDTGGENRFKPPRPFQPAPGITYDATNPGPACPQSYGTWLPPLALGNITTISEDCLNLNIARPKHSVIDNISKKLPVMIWIHGGSFWVGSNMEPTHQPDGLVLQSVENEYPVIHVAINYRLGFFGFAQSDSLKEERSENAGLRDQRLAIEWVRDNIVYFGGNPDNITIFGQSSGGLAVGLQLLAFGGTKPLPYQRGICESQALEPGITGNFTIEAFKALVDYVGCNTTSLHAPETIACLREFDMQTLFDASFATYIGDIAHNIGDIWLPVVDDDFLPAPPSQLVKELRFGDATYIIGWTDGDVNFFTDVTIATADDTFKFISSYLPAMPPTAVNKLLDLYPVKEFEPPLGTNLTAEFYRSARIFRDVLMVCQPLYLAENMYKRSTVFRTTDRVFLYDFNQTILEPIIEQLYNVSEIGVVHTSEFAYIYGNLSHWNVSGYPWAPLEDDYALLHRASRSWSLFASTGLPSMPEHNVLHGWKPAFHWESPVVMVIGGVSEGLSELDGPEASEAIKNQRLKERCDLINSDEYIGYLQY